MEFKQGEVIICSTGQAGTAVEVYGRNLMVLLANGEMWYGLDSQTRHPQDEADLAQCPLNVERIEPKIIKSKPSRRQEYED